MADVKLNAKISADSKDLKQAMDSAKQSVSTASGKMKQDINSIGGSLDNASKKAKDLGREMQRAGDSGGSGLKQAMGTVMQGLLGIGSKLALIGAGFKALKQMIYDGLIDPLINAKKYAAETAKQVAEINNQGSDLVVKRYGTNVENLKKIALLFEKQRTSPTNEAGNEILTLQKILRENKGGIGELVTEETVQKQLKAQFIQLEKERIKAIETEIDGINTQTAANAEYFKSHWSKTSKNLPFTLQLMEQDRQLKNRAQVLSIDKMNLEGSGMRDYLSFVGGIKGRLDDKRSQRMKEAEGKSNAFVAWENAANDKPLQGQVRAVIEKYKQALKDGIEPERAFAVAQKEVQKILGGKYKEYLKALTDRINAVKTAYENELKAQKRIEQARKRLAEVLEENERERKQERRNRKKQSLDSKIDDLESQNHLSRKDRKRLERLKQQRDNLDRQDEKDERNQRKRQRRKKEQEARDNLELARREVIDPQRRYARAQAMLNRMRTPLSVNTRLGEQVNEVTKGYNGIRTPGVGTVPTNVVSERSQQLDQLHTDLQEIKDKYFFVK